MVINVGSFIGPFLANTVRVSTGQPALIFVACGLVEASALAVALFMFRNLPVAEAAKAKSLGTVLAEMVVVLGNARLMVTLAGLGLIYVVRDAAFLKGQDAWVAAGAWIVLNVLADVYLPIWQGRLGKPFSHPLLQPQRLGDAKLLVFILIFSGVWALYSQIWTNIPLYITSLNPAMKSRIEYFQAVDPIMIVLFQLLVGKWMSRYRALPSMVAGVLISAVAVSTVDLFGGHFGAWAVGLSLAIWAVGEMMFSPRMVEYVSVIAPKDKLALYIGYGFLPFAIGFGLGPSVGAHLVRYFSERLGHAGWVWYAFGIWAVLIALALWVYDKVVRTDEG
jgi:dipeptide/tripeptide permease